MQKKGETVQELEEEMGMFFPLKLAQLPRKNEKSKEKVKAT